MGIKTNEVYGGAFMQKELFEDGHGGYKSMTLTVAGARLGEVEDSKTGQKKPQIVISFQEDEHELGLNVTNCTTLEELFKSKDTDHWIGKKCELYYDPSIMFGKEKKGGFRIRAVGAGGGSAPALASVATKSTLANVFYVWTKIEPKDPAFKEKLTAYIASAGWSLAALSEADAQAAISAINSCAAQGLDVDAATKQNFDCPF